MYQVSVQSCRAVTNCAFFILSLLICCTIHKTFTKNENYYVSSLPIPLRICIFIMFSMINGGGEGIDEGVCGGGGVDG